jgi:putative inorganic carbon (HCO3(-)) transporter
MLPALNQRVASVMEPRRDPALSDRMRLARDAFQLGLDHPILGVGYGRGRLKEGLKSRYQGTPSEGSPVWHTHNVYIELFAETGLLGLGAFLGLILSALWRVLVSAGARASSQRLVGLAIASSLTAAAVAGLGDIPFYHHEPRIFFFSLFALAYLYCQQIDLMAREPRHST